MIPYSIPAGVLLLTLSLVSISGCIASETHSDLNITGKIQYNDLEGGFFGLVTQSGEHYLPIDLPDEYKKDGLTVRVSGQVDPDVMTIQMWGQPLRIHSIEVTGENPFYSDTWYEGEKNDITPEDELEMSILLLKSSTALRETLEFIDTGIKTATADMKGKNLQTNDLTPYLEKIKEIHSSIYEVTLLDRAGKITEAFPDTYKKSVGMDTKSQDLVSALLKNPVPGMSRYIQTVEGNYSINIIYPVFSSSHSVTGYLSVLINPDRLIKETLHFIPGQSKNRVMVFQPDGTLLGQTGDEESEVSLMHGSPASVTPAGNDVVSVKTEDNSADETMIMWNTVSLHNTPWRVLVFSI